MEVPATRITLEIQVGPDGRLGELFVYLNPRGRDWLVQELQALSEKNDHFHLYGLDWTADEIGLSQIAYRDNVITCAKVLLRDDEWDEAHYPHVMQPQRTINDPPA